MAKILTEEEYNALLADRERLEWCLQHGAMWYPHNGGQYLSYDCQQDLGRYEAADNAREAIDKARGAV